MVICLERGANDLHVIQLMPLPLHVSCFIQISLTSLMPAYRGCRGKEAIKWVSYIGYWRRRAGIKVAQFPFHWEFRAPGKDKAT